jgi:hypothetical protein
VQHYRSNLRDLEFNLLEVLRRDHVLGAPPYADLDAETARDLLAEADRRAPPRRQVAAAKFFADSVLPLLACQRTIAERARPGADGRWR